MVPSHVSSFRLGADLPAASILDAVINASLDAVLIHQPPTRITAWNLAAERLFGWSLEEVDRVVLGELFPRQVRHDVQVLIDAAMRGEAVASYECEARRRDGLPLLITMSLWPVFGGRDSPVAALLVARDTTEQRLAQATLAEVESRVRESEALSQVGSWLWDLGTGTVQWSDECHRIHGIDPLDFDGTIASHLAVVHAVDRQRVRDALQRAAVVVSEFDETYRVLRPDGAVHLVRARARTVTDATGAALGLRGVIRSAVRPG
jgi:PAS domain S-box-containing protein